MNYKQQLTVSIGIPAYNEEENIKRLLLSLLAQKKTNFKLKEIMVVSDGSTDRTVQEAENIDDKRVKVIDRKDRQGQTLRQNEIFEQANADFLIMLNADIIPRDEIFLEQMVKAYQRSANAGIVAAKVAPLPSSTYIGKILDWHMQWKTELYQKLNGGDTIRLCHGRARGFSRQAYTNIRWPKVWPEDAYSYLAIKKLRLGFVYCKEAVAYYRSPQNFEDHTRQSVRFLLSSVALSPFFTKEELKKAYAIPKKLFIASVFQGLIGNPLKAIFYIAIYVYCKLLALSIKQDDDHTLWENSKSTKVLMPIKEKVI